MSSEEDISSEKFSQDGVQHEPTDENQNCEIIPNTEENSIINDVPSFELDLNVNYNQESKESLREIEKMKEGHHIIKQIYGVHLVVVLPNNKKLYIYDLPAELSCKDLKNLLCPKNKNCGNLITVSYNDEEVKPSLFFSELSPNDGDSTLVYADYDPLIVNFEFPLGDFKIKCGGKDVKACVKQDGPPKMQNDFLIASSTMFSVKWLPKSYHKAFLGGYRDVRSGNEFHHATAQTVKPKYIPSGIDSYSRETQTYVMKHFGQTTRNTISTQMTKPGIFISCTEDKLKTPGKYEDADTYFSRIVDKVVIIQKYFRRWKSKRVVAALKKQKKAVEEWAENERIKLLKEREDRIAHDLQRRLNPKSKTDFDRLFNALEQWRKEEYTRICNEATCESEKKALLALLTNQEAELINTIGKHQTAVMESNRSKKCINLLKKAAEPKKWYPKEGAKMLEMETPYTLRGKELLDIYESLNLECLTEDERLDILLTLKHTVKEHNCRLTREIMELIDREAYFVMRGVSGQSLKGLRRRILNRFMVYAKTPQFNPEISNYICVPTGTIEGSSKILKKDVLYCSSCCHYKRSNEFTVRIQSRKAGTCRNCETTFNRGIPRYDIYPYKRMLDELRAYEAQLIASIKEEREKKVKEITLRQLDQCDSLDVASTIAETKVENDPTLFIGGYSYCNLMNEEDIRYLIEHIWEKKSIISGWSDLTDLVLTRWHLHQPWSPWNTLLATKREAKIHINSAKLPLAWIYGDSLMKQVKQRHGMARNVFKRIELIGRDFEESRKIKEAPYLQMQEYKKKNTNKEIVLNDFPKHLT